MTPARLKVFCFIAGFLEPFLLTFQSSSAQVPILSGAINACLLSLLQLVVKDVLLQKCKKTIDLINLDLSDKSNLCPKPCIGFAAEQDIRNLLGREEVKIVDVAKFRTQVQQFVVKVVHKISEKNPVLYAVTRNSPCFCLAPRLLFIFYRTAINGRVSKAIE